ncbi:hypothetical protein DRQ00_08875 [candidate division KSB1 bacterium]|nr:MAG: hypothetical protein DRQ00_08875 [candidate division KSB1 bacterium]
MQLGIWTDYYMELSPVDALKRLAGLGWKDVELSAGHTLKLVKDPDWPDLTNSVIYRQKTGGLKLAKNSGWQERLEPVMQVIEEEGIKVWQIHSPLDQDVADFDPARRETAIELISRSLDVAHALSAPYTVIHPGGNIFAEDGSFRRGYRSKRERDRILELNVSAFRQFCEKAEKWGLCVCAENGVAQGFCDWIYELWELIEAVGSKALGICFDSSHANCLGLDIPEAIRECGDRLWATHMSDNDGTADQHRMPFCGNIDWINVIAALKEVGYRNLFDLEIGGERCNPIEVQDAKLRFVKEVLEPMLK